MAYEASTQTAADGFEESRSITWALHQELALRQVELETDSNADVVLSILYRCLEVKNRLNAIKDIPFIAEYAISQVARVDYDPVAEFLNMIAALDAIIAHIGANFPKDANGYLTEKKWNADYSYSFFQFPGTAPAVVTLRSLIGDYLLAVD